MLVEKRGRGRGLSFIAAALSLAPVVHFPLCIIVICGIISYFFYPAPAKTTPVTLHVCVFVYSLRDRHKTSASFENANGFYLWPAPVREWVSVLREVFFFIFLCAAVRAARGYVFVRIRVHARCQLAFVRLFNTVSLPRLARAALCA